MHSSQGGCVHFSFGGGSARRLAPVMSIGGIVPVTRCYMIQMSHMDSGIVWILLHERWREHVTRSCINGFGGTTLGV